MFCASRFTNNRHLFCNDGLSHHTTRAFLDTRVACHHRCTDAGILNEDLAHNMRFRTGFQFLESTPLKGLAHSVYNRIECLGYIAEGSPEGRHPPSMPPDVCTCRKGSSGPARIAPPVSNIAAGHIPIQVHSRFGIQKNLYTLLENLLQKLREVSSQSRGHFQLQLFFFDAVAPCPMFSDRYHCDYLLRRSPLGQFFSV